MTSAEPMEYRGKTMYNQRNYNPKNYTLNNMRAFSTGQAIWTDFIKNVGLAKTVCLKEAERDPETTMFAIEKDEDYHGQFKECIKTKMSTFLNERSSKNQLSYTLKEDVADTAVDKALD